MKITIKIENKKIALVLKSEKDVIDKFSWEEDRNLSQRLLVEIDNLLQKNKLTAKDVEKVKVETDIDDKFTSIRIAKIVAKTFNKCLNL